MYISFQKSVAGWVDVGAPLTRNPTIDFSRSTASEMHRAMGSTRGGRGGRSGRGRGMTAGAARRAERTPQQQRPNFFVGFRIADQDLVENMAIQQRRIATEFPDLERCLIDLRTLHVTLCQLHLVDEDEVQEAVEIVNRVVNEVGLPLFAEDLPTFDFRGFGFFGDNFVLYCPLDTTTDYARRFELLAEAMFNAFVAVGLAVRGFRKPFTPHLTIWKTTKFIKYIKELNKQRPRNDSITDALAKFLRDSEPGCMTAYYGSERPTTISLLSMREKESDGFYRERASVSLSTGEDELKP